MSLQPTNRGTSTRVPDVDSAANILMRDVIGNKNDTAAGDSIVSLIKGGGASGSSTAAYPEDIYYVTKNGSDSNTGLSPDEALLTIAAALAKLSAGDAIRVGVGTYDEAGLDLDQNGSQLWLDPGVVLQDSNDGTVLTVSGFGAHVVGSGNVRIDPTGGATGVVVSGGFAEVENVRVNCNSVGGLGFDVTGNGVELWYCRCSSPTIAAYKVQGDKAKLEECCTGGDGGATIGYWLTNSNDKARLVDCGSQGHGSGGFQIDTGCTNTVVWKFSSGGGDGKWTDADSGAVVNGLDYEKIKYATQTFSGGGPGSTNLFEVTGAVEILKIYGHVTTVLANDIGNLNLEFDDGAASDDITAAAAGANSLPVGSFLFKDDDAASGLDFISSANATVVEQPAGFFTGQQPIVPFILVAKAGATNYITSDYSGNAASGVIHWHIDWKPLDEDGYVEVA